MLIQKTLNVLHLFVQQVAKLLILHQPSSSSSESFLSRVPRCCPSTPQLHANVLRFALITAEILQNAKMEGNKGDQTE